MSSRPRTPTRLKHSPQRGNAPGGRIGFDLSRTLRYLRLIVIVFLFTVIFRILPDAVIRWRDAIAGAIFTGVFLVIGKFLIGVYLGNSNLGKVSATFPLNQNSGDKDPEVLYRSPFGEVDESNAHVDTVVLFLEALAHFRTYRLCRFLGD